MAASCSAAAQAGIGKDYTAHGYEFGAWSSRFDLFDAGLNRIEARFGQLIPPPVRKIPIFIGGGLKRTLPAVAHHADIWHSVLSVDAFTEASARVDELAAAIGRDGRTGSVPKAPTPTGRPVPPRSPSLRSTPTPPPAMTSAPWRKCRPGVTVRSEGGCSVED